MPSFHAFTALRISSFPPLPLPPRLSRRLVNDGYTGLVRLQPRSRGLCLSREILVCCSLDAHGTFFFSQFLLYHPVSSPTTAFVFGSFSHSLVQRLQVSSIILLSVGNEISFQHPFSALSILSTEDSSTKPFTQKKSSVLTLLFCVGLSSVYVSSRE